MNEKTELVARLNDKARTAMGIMSRLIQTEGINNLSQKDQSAIREKVETYDTFGEDNDPYGERDFGNFDYKGQTIFWKIDYYNNDLSGGSEDPSDVSKTTRVLTIMLAHEY